jgi:hypothetical protein
MKKIKMNKALQNAIEEIRNSPYTEEIVAVSDVKLLDGTEHYIVSETQGDQYRVELRFTAMIEVSVTYVNRYYGKMTDKIVAGFDAIRYTKCNTAAYEGNYMDSSTIKVEFVGEYAKIL